MTPVPITRDSRITNDAFAELPGAGQAIVYLDFDGCLHHEAVHWDPVYKRPFLQAPVRYTLFQHANLLNEMLAPHPNVTIVLSTSWVARYGLTKSANELPAGLRTRVVGSIYDSQVAGEPFVRLPRGEQVAADVARRRPVRWLALDDDPLGWPAWALPHLLLTDPYEGVSTPELQSELRRRVAVLSNGAS